MEKKLTKNGTSYSVILPKTILDLMEINPKKHLVKLEFKNNKIIITKGSSFEE
jgi:antitoxin component of MazEF toxin-antitoxin module